MFLLGQFGPRNANQGLGPRHRYRGQRRRGPKTQGV